MAVTAVVNSYGDESRKNDVARMVEILSPVENWFYNNLGKESVTDTIVSTMTDTLRTAASAAVAEEGDYTNGARTTPTRVTNVVELVAIPFRVSRTQQALQKYTGEDELARQTAKALKDFSNAVEFDLVRSTLVSGVSGTAPKLNGILNAISLAKNTSAQSSGTVFSSTILKAMLQDNWDNSNGEIATDLFCGSFLRSVLDTFTQKNATTVYSEDVKRVVDATSIYETSFGTLMLHTHRYIQQSGDATGRVLIARPEKLKVGILEAPYIDDGLARSGDYDNRGVIGKVTLRVYNQESHVYQTGFDID